MKVPSRKCKTDAFSYDVYSTCRMCCFRTCYWLIVCKSSKTVLIIDCCLHIRFLELTVGKKIDGLISGLARCFLWALLEMECWLDDLMIEHFHFPGCFFNFPMEPWNSPVSLLGQTIYSSDWVTFE